MINIEIIEDTDTFLALKDEWTELLQSSSANCVFLTWEWMFTWWQELAEDRKLWIIKVSNDGQLLALVPLVLRPSRLMRLLPFRVLEFIGSGNVGSDYLNMIIRSGHEDTMVPVISEYVASRQLVLELSQVDRASAPITQMALRLREKGWCPTRSTNSFSPYIPLSRYSWESYLQSLSSKQRGTYLKKMRKLEKTFDVRLEEVTTEVQRRDALAVLVDLHLKRWDDRGGSNALHRGDLVSFHEAWSRTALREGWLSLYVLRLDDKPAAAVYGFRYNKVFYYYQAGFDPDYAQYSLGVLALGMTIRSAMEEGLEVYDFLHGDEDYKYRWTQEARELVKIDLFPPSLRGAVCQSAMSMRWSVKRTLWPWLPSRVRDWLLEAG